MEPRFFILHPLDMPAATESQNLLGTVVKDPRQPLLAFYPRPQDDCKAYFEELPPVNVHGIQATFPSAKGREWAGGLDKVAGVAHDHTQSASLELGDVQSLTYRRIKAEVQVFQQLARDSRFLDATRPWYRSELRKVSACMIVGLLTCDGAEFRSIKKQTTKWRAHATLPIVTAALEATVGFSVGAGDPTLQRGTTNEDIEELKGSLSSSKIIGIEYRWVHRVPLRSVPRLRDYGPKGTLLADSDDAYEEGQFALGPVDQDWSVLLSEANEAEAP